MTSGSQSSLFASGQNSVNIRNPFSTLGYVALVAIIVTSLALAAFSLPGIGALTAPGQNEPILARLESAQTQVAMAALLAVMIVVGAVTFSLWLWRTAANIRSVVGLASSMPGVSQRLAIAPFVNLLRARTTIHVILEQSVFAGRLSGIRGEDRILSLWWWSWIVSVGLTIASAALWAAPNAVQIDAGLVNFLLVLSFAGLVVASVLSMRLMGLVNSWHSRLESNAGPIDPSFYSSAPARSNEMPMLNFGIAVITAIASTIAMFYWFVIVWEEIDIYWALLSVIALGWVAVVLFWWVALLVFGPLGAIGSTVFRENDGARRYVDVAGLVLALVATNLVIHYTVTGPSCRVSGLSTFAAGICSGLNLVGLW
jgi:hypothetical protein